MDGRGALHVLEFEGHESLLREHRAAVGLYFTVRLLPKQQTSRLRVVVSDYFWTQFRPDWYDFVSDVPREEAIREIAIASIGSHLDGHGMPAHTPSGTTPFSIELDDQALLANRVAATDQEVFNYVAAKLYWAWKFGLSETRFTLADRIRLYAPKGDIRRVAIRGEELYWEMSAEPPRAGETSARVTYVPTAALLNDFENGRMPGQSVSPTFQVQEKLSAPRYAAAKEHFSKAVSYMAGPSPDWPNAAKEAVTAVESLAKIVSDREDETLGKAVAHLRATGKLAPPLDRVFDALWGYTSSTPGVRHGGTSPPTITETEAAFVVNLSASAILYLLNADR